jgi:hypothetical protein
LNAAATIRRTLQSVHKNLLDALNKGLFGMATRNLYGYIWTMGDLIPIFVDQLRSPAVERRNAGTGF